MLHTILVKTPNIFILHRDRNLEKLSAIDYSIVYISDTQASTI